MAETPGLKVFNQDVVLVVQQLNRFIEEMMLSQSANVSGMTPHDRERLLNYIKAQRHLRDWVQAQPILDLPETHPRSHQLEPDPIVPDIENDAVAMIIRMLEAARTELVHGASARQASRLSSFDASRWTALIDKLEKFVLDYIDAAEPLDLPESSPQEDAVPPGRKGV